MRSAVIFGRCRLIEDRELSLELLKKFAMKYYPSEELDNVKTQFETAKVDVEKPFNQEEELKTKTARLNELNALLNVDKRENEIVGGEPDEGDEQPEKKAKEYER